MPRTYAYLKFQSGIDWQDVNPLLLAKLNRLGMRIGKTITVISGYRTYAEQAALYQRYLHGGNIAAKPGHSYHEKGLAVDALIDGQAIGKVVSAQMFKKVGLTSLSSIGDYPHVQMSGKATAGTHAGAAPQQPDQQQADQPQADPSQMPGLMQEPQVPGPPSPESTIAPVLPPEQSKQKVRPGRWPTPGKCSPLILWLNRRRSRLPSASSRDR